MARPEPSLFVEDEDVAEVVLKETARERGRGRGRRGGHVGRRRRRRRNPELSLFVEDVDVPEVVEDVKGSVQVMEATRLAEEARVAAEEHGEPSDVCLDRPLLIMACLLYTSPSPRDGLLSRMPSSA